MDQWNHRNMMFPGMSTGVPPNTNNQQNFYRSATPQQFYPTPGSQFHGGFQPRQSFPQNVNPMAQNLPPNASQAHPARPMTPAELENLKKKRNFEEQQKRLMALKQKGAGGSMASRVENPLNDLFGKGNSGGMKSLLGSLGDVSHSKLSSSSSYQGVPSMNPTPGPPQSSGDFEQFQGFNSRVVQDDFGDFQQSSGMQFPVIPTTGQPDILPNTQSSILGIKSSDQQKPTNTDFLAATNSNQLPRSTSGNTGGHVESKAPVPSTVHNTETKMNASTTPSIEDLMKKSLALDSQSSSSGRRFEKPKISKTIKVQPSHFTESTKASKFENLDSLSEIFTIPQAALAQPLDSGASLSHVTANSCDDWSDFSSATESVFQQQNSLAGLAAQSIGQGITNSPTRHPSTGQMLYTSEQTTFQREGDCGTLQEHRDEMEIFQPPASAVHTGSMWIPPAPSGSGGTLVGLNIAASQGLPGQQIVSGGEFGDFQSETPVIEALPPLVHDQAPPDVSQEAPAVDPELVIYGVSLPEWTKNTAMLPAVYAQIHKMCSSSDAISTSQLYPILLSSDLPRDKLGYIWSKCNKAIPGELNEKELYLILGMVALAQVGLQVNKLTLEKLASCTAAPIPSFPESIFQSDANPIPDTPLPSTTTPNPPETIIPPIDLSNFAETTFHPTPHIDAVKHPDWSKWKTSKAAQIDDKFTDFQILKSNNTSVPASVSNLNWSTTDPSSADLQSLSISRSFGTTDQPSSKAKTSDEFSIFAGPQSLGEGSLVAVETNKSEVFGEMTSQQFESKVVQNSSHVMPVPLQASQRYTLTEEGEGVDHHEKAWLKCLTSCFTVIMKSCQTLQNISDPNVMNEVFSSQHGMLHFSAIIEIYCIAQRVKASALKSAPNNKKLKESLQNIDNVWKTYTTFEPFQKMLPRASFNFSSCYINDGDDVNMSCGVCLLHVDKSCITSSQRIQRRTVSYGNRQYHTTCANFWCNKVDSVLPSLIFNNSLI